jgi:hypothetical protein
MRHTTKRCAEDDIPEIELVTLKVTQLDEETWRWELIDKRYLVKGRTDRLSARPMRPGARNTPSGMLKNTRRRTGSKSMGK